MAVLRREHIEGFQLVVVVCWHVVRVELLVRVWGLLRAGGPVVHVVHVAVTGRVGVQLVGHSALELYPQDDSSFEVMYTFIG